MFMNASNNFLPKIHKIGSKYYNISIKLINFLEKKEY